LRVVDGFVFNESYIKKEVAEQALRESQDIMVDLYCPLLGAECRMDCMFLDEGGITQEKDGSFMVHPPKCTWGKT
jgi:hypothetical protein